MTDSGRGGAGASIEFLSALATRIDVRLVVFVPLSHEPQTLWLDTPDDAERVADLDSAARAWLTARASSTSEGVVDVATAADHTHQDLALGAIHSPDGAVVGALVAAKSPGGRWTAAELVLVDLASEFYAEACAQTVREGPGVTDGEPPRAPRLERWMRVAPERGELALHYQPEIDMRNGNIVAVEALVRWDHPRRGLLGPDSFIALAEQSDLISVVGNWVIKSAVAEFASWLHGVESRVVLAINVSPAQLADNNTVSLIAATLEQYDLPGNQLCVEITENPMDDRAELAPNIEALRKLGVHIALDDLAAGFSGLGRLHALPVDTVKLDRSLVSGIGQDARAQAIVRALVGLSEELGLELVAEGVENGEEAAVLVRLGCFHAQGHLFGKAMTAPAIRELVRDGRVELPT